MYTLTFSNPSRWLVIFAKTSYASIHTFLISCCCFNNSWGIWVSLKWKQSGSVVIVHFILYMFVFLSSCLTIVITWLNSGRITAHAHTHPHTSVSHGKRRDTRDEDWAPLRISSEVKLLRGEASHGEGEQTVRTNTANVFFWHQKLFVPKRGFTVTSSEHKNKKRLHYSL